MKDINGSGVYSELSEWFWNPTIWLPPNTTWNQLVDKHGHQYTVYSDVYLALPLAILFCFLRLFLERFVYTPLGVSCGLRYSKTKKAPLNAVLEKAFKANGRTGYRQIQGLAKQLDWSERQVERWFRLRRQQSKPCTLTKFCESGWKFSYYLFAFVYGIAFLWNKPWMWDSRYCWFDYPHHYVSRGLWWYYMFQMAFYYSLLVFQFFDTKRKDFWQMFVHHVVAILLMLFSWACNMVRIGSLVLVIHDFADISLEAAKMAKYINKQRLCDSIFGFFTLSWFVTRLGVFPYKVVYPSLLNAPIITGKLPYCESVWCSLRVVYSTMFEAPTILPMFSAYYIFNSLLICLQVLHIIWSYMILRIALTALKSGKTGKDSRSSDSDDSEVSERSDTPQPMAVNNKTANDIDGVSKKKPKGN